MPKPIYLFLLVPLIFAACAQNNVTGDGSLQKYFDTAGVRGSFGLFDNGQGKFTICNLPRLRDSAYLPAGTFDIFLSLIGIQTGVIRDDSAFVFAGVYPPATGPAAPGDKTFDLPALTLRQAFRSSSDTSEAAFGSLAVRIGRDTLKRWIDSLGYGNKNISGPVSAFWLNNHLKVTADEELGIVKKLYFDQLPFFQHTQQIVRRMMLVESNANYQLYYQTGSGFTGNGHALGWVVGWVEENKHPYFFVVNVESPDRTMDIRAAGTGIARGILRQMGFFLGKR